MNYFEKMMNLNNPELFKEACLIDGKWVNATSNEKVSVINPFDQAIIASVPKCGASETEQAIEAADRAWVNWRQMSAKERSDFLWAWAQNIEQNQNDLAYLMTLEQGKPLSEALSEIDYANSFIKWFAEEGRRVYGDIIPSNKRDQHLVVIKQPIGVVAAITPWNFPAAMITRKIAPALAVGCTAVVKPDEQTPLTAFALGVLAQKAGLPKGVLNIITGNAKEIGNTLCASKRVRKLSFTGSTQVGKQLMAQCADTVKKLTLELGGNAPFIVFEDADLDKVLEGVMISKFRNTGQTCVCANRILVHESVKEIFCERLKQAMQALKVGNGLEEGVQQGPLINEKALMKVKQHINDAVQKGAQLQCGGREHSASKLCYAPTLLTNVNETMLLAKEETFGPVAAIFTFSTEQEAIDLANRTEYGLAAYFYSQNIDRVWRVSEALEYGMIGVNTGLISTEVAPFGGVKASGMGREGSKYGLEPYLEIKYIAMGSGKC